MSVVVPLRADGIVPPVWLTKKQLGRHPSINRSVRWIEGAVRRGLPSRLDEDGRKFYLPDVLPWIAEHHPDLAHAAAARRRVQDCIAPQPPGVRTGLAAQILGVSPHTLRGWERRYGFPVPVRTDGTHRRYDRALLAALRDALAESGGEITRAIELAQQRLTGNDEPAGDAAAEGEVAALRQRIAELEAEVRELREPPGLPPAA